MTQHSAYLTNKMTTSTQPKIWFQGNEYWKEIYNSIPTYTAKCTHEQLAKFSCRFTNCIGDRALPNLVYLDSGCGFKVRGYFSHQEETALNWREFSTHQVKNKPFGTWFGFPFCRENGFYFESCNGNKLVAFADWESYDKSETESYHIEITLADGNEERTCNYKKYLEEVGLTFATPISS